MSGHFPLVEGTVPRFRGIDQLMPNTAYQAWWTLWDTMGYRSPLEEISGLYMGLSENSVPNDPMVNDH